MANLVDLLLPDTPLHLLQGQVFGTAGGGTYVHITWGAGVIYNAGAFDGASFTVGDYVWFLLSDEAGALVLGKQTPGPHDTSTPPPGTPLIVSATSYATYDQVAGTWTASTLVQSPTSFACWFYSTAAFSTVAGKPLSAFELEVTRTAGGPPEIGPHLNSAGSGAFVTDGDRWLRDQPPVGVATWLPLPLDWGMRLATGNIKGLAIGGGDYSGTYSNGTGRVRLTPT